MWPTVSVLLPNYNHARFIGTALDALAAQTRAPHEIVVIDDASTDDSVAVIESFGEKLPQLRLLRNPRNLGVSGAVNRGLAEARSTHVVSSAADDWLEPDFIAQMSAAVAAHPQRADLRLELCAVSRGRPATGSPSPRFRARTMVCRRSSAIFQS